MTFPRLTTYTDTPVDPEIQRRRAAFAAKLVERRGVAKPDPENATALAEAFGRQMFELCGKGWSGMIGIAAEAAMKAQREALDKVLP